MGFQEVQAVLVLTIVIALSLPSNIYCLYVLTVCWKHDYFEKRKRSVIGLMSIGIVFCSLIEIPSYAVEVLLSAENNAVMFMMTMVTRFVLVLLFNLRIWLLFFDYHYHYVLASEPWQALISPASIEKNWFYAHKKNMGSPKFLILWLVVPLSVTAGILTYFLCVHQQDASQGVLEGPYLYYHRFHLYDALLITLYAVVTMVFILVIWRKYPKYDDVYHIRSELKNTFVYVAVCGSTVPLTVVLAYSLKQSTYLLFKCSSSFIWMFMLYFMIIYPKRAMMSPAEKRRNSFRLKSLRINGKKTKSPSLTDHDHIEKNRRMAMSSWQTEVSTEKGYRKFAMFLSREFSIEVCVAAWSSCHDLFL